MGGDHKCPVCQATFTRPQHVARHMRSREFSFHFRSSGFSCVWNGRAAAQLAPNWKAGGWIEHGGGGEKLAKAGYLSLRIVCRTSSPPLQPQLQWGSARTNSFFSPPAFSTVLYEIFIRWCTPRRIRQLLRLLCLGLSSGAAGRESHFGSVLSGLDDERSCSILVHPRFLFVPVH
jgi:hypothetical protein